MKREITSIAVFFLLLWIGGINDFFLVWSMVLSSFVVIYFCGCIIERVVMKTDSWFRITPGEPQMPPMDEEEEMPTKKDEVF